jgi:dihydrodipicolinate synthase/N-acetylneuraminate lyase
MDWSASVAPAVCRRFWRASQHGDIASMAEVVREVETPFQAVGGNQFYGDNSGAGGGAFPGGWQGVWRAALEINGVSRRFLRPPNPKPSAADMESLAAVMGRIGLRVMH